MVPNSIGSSFRNKKPKNLREVYPLPFYFEVALEYYLLNSATPESNRLIFGCFLFQFWSGLRFQDLQRILLSSLSIQEGIIRCINTMTKNGQPQPAAGLACGFCSTSFSTGWGYIWMHLMAKWQQITAKKAPNSRWILFSSRRDLGKCAVTSTASIYQSFHDSTSRCHTKLDESTLKTLRNFEHYCTQYKTSLISAGKQLHLPRQWMQEQGHHRGSRNQTDRYLQRTISQQVRSGWKPLVAQARGGQAPLALRSFTVPDNCIS